MSRRKIYNETYTGEADSNIRRIISSDADSGGLKSLLLNIIKNELTERQKEIIMLYYFKELDITEIAKLKCISPQAVSRIMSRARLRIYRIMQYYV